MKSKIGHLIFIAVAIILAAVFIWLTVRQTDFEVLKSAAANANYFWFALSMILSIVSYWLRAARWKLLLDPIGYPIPVSSGFWAISFAYFMNLTIPRSGELARATSLYKMEKVPVDKSLGIIILERVIDLMFLGLFFGLALIFNADTLFSFFSFADASSLGKFSIAAGLLILLILIFFVFRGRLGKIKIFKKADNFITGIIEGFKSILHLKQRTSFILYSVGIWFCYFLMTYLVVFAFPETSNFGLAEGFFLIVAGALGMILPAVGGLGYPYVMSIAFAAIYLTKGQTAEEGRMVGNYFGLMLYFAQIISMLLFGFLSIYFIARISREKSEQID